MRRAVLFATGLLLLGVGLALAQTPENSLPEGTFASTPEDCATLAAKAPAELGEDSDFEVLTKKGLVGYQQTCDFVNVFAHDGNCVATALCDESNYTYPDLFSIDGKLNVTRISDLTQQGGYDSSSQSDSKESDAPGQSAHGAEPGTAERPSGEGKSSDEQASESYSTFVKCDKVKP
jgi:hypothetical protein